MCLYRQPATGTDRVGVDSVLTILEQKDGTITRMQLILAIQHYFEGKPMSDLQPAKKKLDSLLLVYGVTDASAIKLVVEAIYRMELKRFADAEKTLAAATDIACRENDHYLLYVCFTQWYFLQTVEGNMPDALASLRQARKEAVLLNDAYLQALAEINTSDFYYRNKLPRLSLIYINQAERLMKLQKIREPIFSMEILVNKGENYFELGQVDSLAKYSRQLMKLKVSSSSLYTYQQRSSYLQQLLIGGYKKVLARIMALKCDVRYSYEFVDDKNLAIALYHMRESDSAQSILNRLVSDISQKNHPEQTLSLYEMLGHISMEQANKSQAILRFEEALQQAKMRINSLIEINTNATRLKLDEVQGNYIQSEKTFRRERFCLIVCIVIICAISVIGAILYRSIHQERHFEKSLFEARRNELAFINSHEVRRHLSNILGIIDTIRISENKQEIYMEVEAHLMKAAADLDSSIRNIADKLNN